MHAMKRSGPGKVHGRFHCFYYIYVPREGTAYDIQHLIPLHSMKELLLEPVRSVGDEPTSCAGLVEGVQSRVETAEAFTLASKGCTTQTTCPPLVGCV